MSKAKVRERRIISLLSLVLMFVVAVSTEAQAELFDIWGVVENNSNDPVTDQLSVDVTDEGGGQVRFTFINALGGDPSSITGIYFDDGPLGALSSIDDSHSGVSYISPATSPAELKGANTVDPPFETTMDFSAQSDTPPYHDGVNPGEYVGIVFDINSNFADVIDAIYLGFTHPDDYTGVGSWFDESLRIGVNVQGISDEYSDSYIMTPIPASVVLGILGLGVVGLKLRKFA